MIKRMWEEFPGIWSSQAKYMAWVRGGIRKGLWNRSPIKISFLNEHRCRIPNPNPKNIKRFPEIWGGQCNLCKATLPITQIEVDHKEGNHSLNSSEDIANFIKSIIEVRHDDLQLICKPCHKIKNQMERKGISFEEARAEKLAIEIIKSKKDKEYLENVGITPASTQAKRRLQIIEVLTHKESS